VGVAGGSIAVACVAGCGDLTGCADDFQPAQLLNKSAISTRMLRYMNNLFIE
jgi:hypothetical protein